MLKTRIDRLLDEINECVAKSERQIDDIQLVAITKTHSVETIKEALFNGIKHIGESRVQESEEKIPELIGLYETFHFVGHLQSNKINKLLALKPALIHSIDKFSTAERLNQAIERMNSECGFASLTTVCEKNTSQPPPNPSNLEGRLFGATPQSPNHSSKACLTTTEGRLYRQDVLIEVNTSGEDSKNGIKPSECAELIKRIDELEYVNVKGLMTIGALTENEDEVRRCFALLKELFEIEKDKRYITSEMKYLSMGMSSDYQIAIQEGAHIIRLGSIIFGERNNLK